MDAPADMPGEPVPERGAGAPLRFLRAALPFVLTALAAAALSLAAQNFLFQPAQPAIVVPTSAPAPPATTIPTARPILTSTALPLSQGITQQELADVRAEADRKQAQIYLLLAVVQIDDAELALRSNELASVDQSLVAIDNSLQLAYTSYEHAGDSARDAVAQRRMEVSKLHDDLYLYPESMDQRLGQLRQLVLALITDQQP